MDLLHAMHWLLYHLHFNASPRAQSATSLTLLSSPSLFFHGCNHSKQLPYFLFQNKPHWLPVASWLLLNNTLPQWAIFLNYLNEITLALDQDIEDHAVFRDTGYFLESEYEEICSAVPCEARNAQAKLCLSGAFLHVKFMRFSLNSWMPMFKNGFWIPRMCLGKTRFG